MTKRVEPADAGGLLWPLEDEMERKLIESPGLLPMFETPSELWQQRNEMIAQAPYCGLGFKKSTLEPELHARLKQHLRASIDHFRPEPEIDELQTVDDQIIPALYYEDRGFNSRLSRDLQARHEEWSGMRLLESACYGIRVYQRGSFLYNHVDCTGTHLISSTICVDHRLSSPWPLTIEDIDGNLSQVDMEPGDFILYEGARLTHGRPYPLDGDYYASIFVHYRPVDPPASTPPEPA